MKLDLNELVVLVEKAKFTCAREDKAVLAISQAWSQLPENKQWVDPWYGAYADHYYSTRLVLEVMPRLIEIARAAAKNPHQVSNGGWGSDYVKCVACKGDSPANDDNPHHIKHEENCVLKGIYE